MTIKRVIWLALALVAVGPAQLIAQEAAERGASPFDINVGLSFWTLVVFVVLLVILGRFAWAPILQAVEKREQVIRDALDEAARRNAEASKLLEEHKAQLADARRQANELIAEGRTVGEGLRKDIEDKARAEALAILERARTEIEREKDAALEALRKESVELALAAASRLMQENLDQPKDRAIVERYLSQLGAERGARS
jgi:F-type H+-transporting ATPase subunit b